MVILDFLPVGTEVSQLCTDGHNDEAGRWLKICFIWGESMKEEVLIIKPDGTQEVITREVEAPWTPQEIETEQKMRKERPGAEVPGCLAI